MEKASLIVQKTKKGKIIAKVKILENGKIVTAQKFSTATPDMDGMDVEVLREKGQPVLIKNGEKILFDWKNEHKVQKPITLSIKTAKPKLSSSNDEKLDIEHIEYVQNPAYAPYNFVPLNEKIVKANGVISGDKKLRLTFNAYHDEYRTGWIDLEIKTVTPIFIRGKESEPNFHAPSGKPSIPGSSLRGLIRQMVEIVSFGKFGFFNDKKTLYYRGLADRSNLRNEYQNQMSSYDRNRKISTYNVSAGIIKKKGLSYYINPTEFKRISKMKTKKMLAGLGKKYSHFEFYDLEESQEYKNYYLVVSGNMNNKKHDWLIKKAESPKNMIPIEDENDIQNYLKDKTREVKKKNDEDIPSILNLIELLEKGIKDEVPCFYVRWKDTQKKDRISFGHTAMFRLAYEKSIGSHVPEALIDDSICDIADAMFGNETDFAGRLFFEDAMIEERNNNIFTGEKYMKILSNPKPTTFQHYLVQTEEHLKTLKHYNSNSSIRGNKMYWHKSGSDWEETDIEAINKHPKQYLNSKINPVRAGVTFNGRIRFENLSDIELGALLLSLELPEGCYHKIGMAKPLGLGSIEISPKLYLSNRKNRYKNLFSEWNNEISDDKKRSFFTDIFEKYVLREVNDKHLGSIWNTERLKNLLIILHYNTGTKLEKENKTDYMGLQSFRSRSILPKPLQVASVKTFQNVMAKLKQAGIKTVSEKKQIDDKLSTVAAKNDQLPNHIKEIEIDSLWDMHHIKWKLNNDVNVLIGANGSGKSTVFRLIKHVLMNKPFERENYTTIPKMIRISYDNGESSIYKSYYKISEFKLKMLNKAIAEKGTDEDTEKILLLKDWLKTEKTYDNKLIFLKEISNICGSAWVKKKKHELLSECYDNRNGLKVKDMSEYISNELVVTFDRYLPQKELDKFKGNQSILDHDLEGTLINFITETSRLLFDEKSSKIKSLIKILNTFFQDTEKKVSFDKIKGLLIAKNDKPIELQDLSSGEKQLLYIVLKVFLGSIKNIPMILLLDEPEISLHPRWQLDFINHIMVLNSNMQIIIASHSPALTMGGWKGIETQMHTIVI